LQGDLSLLASPGSQGLPAGHVVAYRANHELHGKFLERLWLEVGMARSM
jgi:hypothetical protein